MNFSGMILVRSALRSQIQTDQSISEGQAMELQRISPISELKAEILSREEMPSSSSPWRVKAPDIQDAF